MGWPAPSETHGAEVAKAGRMVLEPEPVWGSHVELWGSPAACSTPRPRFAPKPAPHGAGHPTRGSPWAMAMDSKRCSSRSRQLRSVECRL